MVILVHRKAGEEGGINSQKLFRLNPEYAKSLGIMVRKDIRKPKPSTDLAEFIGLMLGDGGMTIYQINITLNRETDNEYSIYVQNLIKRLFQISTSIIKVNSDNADRIVVSGANLVEFLITKGLNIGDKIRNKVNIPEWILNNRNYSIACLRGLMDTDGSFYSYLHRVNGSVYKNYALDFTNHSLPLLQAVKNILTDIGCSPTLARFKVVLHKKEDIERYISIVGTSNPVRRNKFKLFNI